MISTDKLTQWLSRLVQIPSVNPAQAGPGSGAPGEAQLAAHLATWFKNFGADIYSEDVHPGRPNIYGIWKGQSERWLAVDVHTDTVGVEQMSGDPFSGRIADGRVYGRGAVDTKATLGVILALLEAMHERGLSLHANLLIAATADEENGAQSAPVFANWLQKQGIPVTQLIIAEPTLCCPVYGHKGGIRFTFTISGRASHTAKPELGKNAIQAAAHLIVALEAEHQRLQRLDPKTELGNPTLSITNIRGGTGGNVVPDSCQVSCGWRSVPGSVVSEITAHLNEIAKVNCPLPVEMNVIGSIEPFYQSPDTPWIRQLAHWSGQKPTTVPYGTNAWAHGDKPYDCVVLGPGSIDQAHSDVEWVAISELEKLAHIYARWWEID